MPLGTLPSLTNNQALLAFARSNNLEAAVMPQLVGSDFLSRNYLKAYVYLRSSYARAFGGVIRRRSCGRGSARKSMFLYDCFEGEIRTRIKTESKLLILVICHLESNLPNVTSLSNQRNANHFLSG